MEDNKNKITIEKIESDELKIMVEVNVNYDYEEEEEEEEEGFYQRLFFFIGKVISTIILGMFFSYLGAGMVINVADTAIALVGSSATEKQVMSALFDLASLGVLTALFISCVRNCFFNDQD